MNFKIDENLPVECADILRAASHDAVTITEEELSGEEDPAILAVCIREGRALVTLDTDFANIHTYPPQHFPGLMVFRLHWQDKVHLVTVLRRVLPLIGREPLKHHLWIIEETRVRIRGEEGRGQHHPLPYVNST